LGTTPATVSDFIIGIDSETHRRGGTMPNSQLDGSDGLRPRLDESGGIGRWHALVTYVGGPTPPIPPSQLVTSGGVRQPLPLRRWCHDRGPGLILRAEASDDDQPDDPEEQTQEESLGGTTLAVADGIAERPGVTPTTSRASQPVAGPAVNGQSRWHAADVDLRMARRTGRAELGWRESVRQACD
jgi:hypothetical protein